MAQHLVPPHKDTGSRIGWAARPPIIALIAPCHDRAPPSLGQARSAAPPSPVPALPTTENWNPRREPQRSCRLGLRGSLHGSPLSYIEVSLYAIVKLRKLGKLTCLLCYGYGLIFGHIAKYRAGLLERRSSSC